MMRDFFVSYTGADENWAEWIAWTLEDAGYKVVLQKWDFAAGSNFVLEMQKAATQAERTIAVMSPDYLTASRFGAAEWAAAFVDDPDGMKRRLVPVRVRECRPDGLLKGIVYIDFVDLDEAAAKRELLEHVKGERRKPAAAPSFPGPAAAATRHAFPGAKPAPSAAAASTRYMPKIKSAITDVDRRRFIRNAFALIQERFGQALKELAARNKGIDSDLTQIDGTKFTAEIFLAGKSHARCKIWIGGMFGSDNISYAEGQTSLTSNAVNDDLSLHEVDGELMLRAIMGAAMGNVRDGLDLERLSAEDAAEYFWRRFSSGLER